MYYYRRILTIVGVCVLLPPSKSSFGDVGVKDRCAYFSCPFCYLLDKSRKKHTSWWHSRRLLSYIRGIFLSVCGQLFSYWSKNSASYYFFTVHIWKLVKKSIILNFTVAWMTSLSLPFTCTLRCYYVSKLTIKTYFSDFQTLWYVLP